MERDVGSCSAGVAMAPLRRVGNGCRLCSSAGAQLTRSLPTVWTDGWSTVQHTEGPRTGTSSLTGHAVSVPALISGKAILSRIV